MNFKTGGNFQTRKGCIIECDLEYPKELHKLHNEYPLAPKRVVVNKVEKLIPNLRDKTKYVIHHENLKLDLDLCMKLKKIYHGISFTEEAWMKSYMEKNTKLQGNKDATEFEKDFYKLMNNGVLGNTMENIRNRIDVR